MSTQPTAPEPQPFEIGMNALLRIDPASTMVLTIDMQRDYLDLEVASSPVLESEARRVLTATRDLLSFARGLGIPVVHAYSTRRPQEISGNLEFGGVQYLLQGRANGLSQNPLAGPKPVDRVIGSPQAEVHPDLVAEGDIHVPTKKTFDSYLYSDLDFVVGRLLKPTTVVLCGINTDSCVFSTTFSTANRGYVPVVVRDCVASMRGIDRHEMALTLMSRSMAWVLTLDELKAKVTGAGAERVTAAP
jgi:nicotinamidase-related amidase